MMIQIQCKKVPQWLQWKSFTIMAPKRFLMTITKQFKKGFTIMVLKRFQNDGTKKVPQR